jgi:hypothetical protein
MQKMNNMQKYRKTHNALYAKYTNMQNMQKYVSFTYTRANIENEWAHVDSST